MNGQHQIAYGYIRVSTVDQAEEGVSLAAQREKIGAYCALHGLTLAGVFEDAGLSGKRADNRPGLQAALAATCKAKGVLIVYSLSRLARSTKDAIAISERIGSAGAALASLTERIDTSSSMGTFFFSLMAALGQLERDQVSERTTHAMAHLRRSGKRISGRLPFGYDLGPDGETLLENPAEQVILRRMERDRRAGMSYGEIANRLTLDRVPSKLGSAWYASTVRSGLLFAQRRSA